MATAKQFQVNTLSGGTLTTGLVSYWNMQGNSNDYWGTNNGTDTSVTYGTSYGKVAEGGYFNGSAYSSLPQSLSIGTGDFSVSIWGKWNANSALQQGLITLGSASTNESLQIYMDNSNTIKSGFYGGGGGVASGVTPTLGTFYHVVVVGHNQQLSIYVNGVYKNIGPSVSYNLIGNSFSSIGGWSAAYLNNGDVDEIGFWSKVLSTQEITDLYNGGAGQTMLWGDTQSDSMMNADSRFATVAFTKRFVAALAATIMNAASRFTTLAGNLLILIRNVSVTMMNAASRLTMIAGTITKYVTALSVSMMNSVSRFVTIFAQPSIYFRTLSVSMMNSVSRLAVLTTGNMKILVVNMMNAAGRFTTLFSQQMLFIRNLSVNMMYAVNRLTSFLVTIPGTWAFRAKNLTSWAFRSKNNTSWTFRTKNPPGAENIPSEPN